MIISAIDIENYKQYAGSHRIEFPEAGVVAITGPNGAGKTTLFEAIEWCLYCPRSIPQAAVPPHEGIGRTVVRITLEDTNDGRRYCVQRELRASGSQAEVYLEDTPGEPLVQGTREVTRYVARHLVGLPHGAFVSTFFTKQRELQFFGDRSATERRTEIGKLLGLEAVREAQGELGEGRTMARSLADARTREYERRIDGRDLDAESTEAARRVAEAELREGVLEAAARETTERAEHARSLLDDLRELQARDGALSHQIATLTGQLSAAAARRDGAVSELRRLELRAEERTRLAEAALTVSEQLAHVERHEHERDRARRFQSLQEAEQRACEARLRTVQQLEALVLSHLESAEGIDGWYWSPSDAGDPGAAAERLWGLALALDTRTHRARLEAMQEIVHKAASVAEVAAQLARFNAQLRKLEQERAAALRAGDPERLLEEALAALQVAREREHKIRMALATVRTQREDSERLATNLREHREASICPTCSRPLGPAESAQLLADVAGKIAAFQQREDEFAKDARLASRAVAAEEERCTETRKRLEGVRGLDVRLAEGERMIAEAEQRHQAVNETLELNLAAHGLNAVPEAETLARVKHEVERVQRIAGLAPLLERLQHDAEAACRAQDAVRMEILDLGQVSFNEADLLLATEALREAQKAEAQVLQIDVELASHGRYEEQKLKEECEMARLGEEREAIVGQRIALGFDPDALVAALEAEQTTRAAAANARDHHAAARQDVRDARSARERLDADHLQLKQLVEEADQKGREADELTRMYDEFGEFDRYVARHVGPLLADTTEKLLAQVTNGKFDHVRFDENYGIEVFDGDESFPIASFSGGERDIVALCARLALSEVVGSAAVRPPRFLVLDEVFGSLDSERRLQLLETLGGLAHAGHFRQMFIISHVEDVQQSPVMTEAWTIVERDGVSRVVRPSTFEAGA